MDPEVTGAELLNAAQRALIDMVVPYLRDDRRHLALMIGSAVRMVAREIVQRECVSQTEAALFESEPPSLDACERASRLSHHIREGRYDADTRLHAALWANAVARTSISKPSALVRVEWRLAGLESEIDFH